ncbi:Protein of unknown function DUF58 [Nocardioides scoriae]|uniref:DUF58 domain-containing protein n=1 Tax=Nocardioides scoriae TaxID=642780 RepID=A0A1H1L7D9_9ACTN|nr:DUF58 domain-containing protein [Nocardioides scoriae]SDR70260.1 Protein of unknown function DUF58 [Nocardioides scoriae]
MRDLTVRGRCFLAAGLAAVICGVQIGERDFVRIGLLALAVPLVAWVLVRRSERRVWVRRDLSSLRVEAGDTAQVQVELGPQGRRRTGVLLVEETLPEALGAGHQFLVDPLEAGGRTTLHYALHARQRGRYPVGPLHLHVSDPLGMADLDEELDSSATLLVTPRTEALPRIALTGRWAGAGENRARELLGGGSPDTTIREYRLGDDLRRIHWPTSARTSELMVRREEQEWQLRCTLLLDHRRRSHRGRGAASSLEAAVSAAASVLRHLTAQGFEVRLVTAAGRAGSPGWHQGDRGVGLQQQLERLAVLGAGTEEQLATDWVDETQHGGMLVAVLGHLDDGDRRTLAGLASAGDAAYAVVLDVAGWERHAPTHGAGLTHHHASAGPATTDLRLGGWKAATLTRDGSLPAAWQELGR